MVPPRRGRRGELEDELENAPQTDPTTEGQAEPAQGAAPIERKEMSAAARRALAEAEARRRQTVAPLPPEINGRGGLEPVRYHDWEIKGLANDF
jgi:hypothetical protein